MKMVFKDGTFKGISTSERTGIIAKENKPNACKIYQLNQNSKLIIKESEGVVVFLENKYGKTFKGVAKCNFKYDEFDEQKGIAIARAKCDIKILRYELKQLCK